MIVISGREGFYREREYDEANKEDGDAERYFSNRLIRTMIDNRFVTLFTKFLIIFLNKRT